MTSIVSIQNSLNAGELSPSLFGRTDLEKWKSGTSTCRNFFVNYRGGVVSRPGLAYVGTCLQQYPNPAPRDIPFQFNINQGYALEFGTNYMRVKTQGAYVTDSTTREEIVPMPFFGGIEAFIGASTPVGYISAAGTVGKSQISDRSVPYIIQLESSAVTTGVAGLHSINFDSNGDEAAQATVTDLGTTEVEVGRGAVVHPNGNVYFTDSGTNSTKCIIARCSDLALVGSFGVHSGTLGSDATHFSSCIHMIPNVNGSTNQLVTVGLSAAFNDELALWNCTSTSLSFLDTDTSIGPNIYITEGSRGSGLFYALSYPTYGGGGVTPFGLYKGDTTLNTIALTHIADIAPATIDATWSNFSTVGPLGRDNEDGNLLAFVTTPDPVTHKNYLVKFNATSGAVIWKTAVLSANALQCDLSRSYMNGLLQIFDKATNSVISYDLSDGSTTSAEWNHGIAGAVQYFDHLNGLIFLLGPYAESASGPTPIYTGGYLATHGNIVPSNRWMGLYSVEDSSDTVEVVVYNYAITNITQDNPGVVTIDFDGDTPYAIGDWIYFANVESMTNWNGLTWIVDTNPSPGQYTFTDLFGEPVDTSNWPVYVSNSGVVARIFTLDTPYAGEDLQYIKYAQSADVMTLTCVNQDTGTEYAPYSLTRLGNADWTLVQDSFGSLTDAPENLTATAFSSSTATTWYSYVVTAVSRDTGEESVASNVINVLNNDIAVYQGSNLLTWDAVDGASSYNIYAAPAAYSSQTPTSSVFGYIGTSLGPSYSDTNVTPDFTVVPPVHYDPFALGAITDIIVTAGGTNYSESTISWVLNTSTGVGFDGFPVVANGAVVGFVVTNPGSGYAATDTITFSDSGGGLAKTTITASINPPTNDRLNLNGSEIVFATLTHYDKPEFMVLVGGDVASTLQNLVAFLNSTANIYATNLNVASYSIDTSHLYITYKTPGTAGNSFAINTLPGGWTSSSGATLSGGGVAGSGATATLSVGPTTGTFPSVPAYFQQRKVYANSMNKPDTYWMSQVGLYSNFDTSIPVTDADSITGTPWAQQVNGIQWMVPMPGGLVTLTGKSAWQVNGGGASAITPANQTAVAQAYNGCNNIVTPITINYDILYIQAKGSIARDLAYNFYTNIYTGTDLTVLSNHLFTYNTILQWCWCEEPFKIVWALRNDGILLALTYLKEQEVIAWTRHDTNGLFVSVCSVTEPPVDALYVIVQRYVNGAWRYYSERMNNRMWSNVEQSYCVDSGLSYPVPNYTEGLAYVLSNPAGGLSDANPMTSPAGTLSASANTGTGVIFTKDSSDDPFTADSVGLVIRGDGGKATITHYTSATQVTADVTSDLTMTIPNDPDNTPLPMSTGTWSISLPTTTVRNLNHLEGLEVAILADGGVVDNQTVTDGQITLDNAASIVTIGLPYTCQVQTLYIDHPDKDTVQNKRKLISSVGLRVEATRGLQIGSDQVDASTQQNYAPTPWTNLIEIKGRMGSVNAGTAMPLYTGDYYNNLSSAGWKETGQIAIQQAYPLPASILSLVAYWQVGDDK